MNTRIFLLTIISIMISGQLFSGEVSLKNAKVVANNFYFEKNSKVSDLDFTDNYISSTYPVELNSQNVFYFINYRDGGWVAVSASDAVIPVIAYSFEGFYSPDYEPDNFKMWISQYKSQIFEAIADNEIPPSTTSDLWAHYLSKDQNDFLQKRTGRSVEPMIKSTWDQGLFYNEMCPDDPGGPGGHCLTGCVPTCMGQICNYFRFPQSGTGSYSYSCPPYGELSADFSLADYNWNEMAGNLNDNNLETAELLFHLGVSCDIVYGPDGSGMYNHKAAYALRTHFKYSPETEYLYRDSTNLNWDSVIIAHLDRKIPLYYAGWSVPNINGHAFVCDGYQDGNYFHFNWGWSGSYDGYFYTGNLNPGGNNFNLAQELIINCFPDTVNYQYPLYCTGTDTLLSTLGTIDDGSGPVYDYINDQECSWLISPSDSVNFIILEFLDFNTMPGDTLYVYDGGSINSPILEKISGNSLPDNISSSSDEVFLKFVSNSQDVSEGWLVSYTTDKPVFCSNNQIFTQSGSISDGSGPANYQNQTTCLWLIQPADGGEITLKFNDFDTEADHDFVTVYDGSEKIGEFSGSELPPDVVAVSGVMTVVFSTNSSITAQGWSASFETSTVGLVDTDIEDVITINPNPADKSINLNVVYPYEELTIKMYDLYGEKVYENTIRNNRIIEITTSELASGMYILNVSGGEISATKKVIIKHR